MPQREWECDVQPQAGAAREEQDLSSLFLMSLQNDEYGVPLPEEDFKPKGPSWLYHSDAIRTYLSLMDQSKKDATLEACAGALQNLTASRGLVRASVPSACVHPNVPAPPWNQRVSKVGKTSKVTDHHHFSAMKKENVLLKPQGTTASLSAVFDPVGCLLTPNSGSHGGYNQHLRDLSQTQTLGFQVPSVCWSHCQQLLVLAPSPRAAVRVSSDVHP